MDSATKRSLIAEKEEATSRAELSGTVTPMSPIDEELSRLHDAAGTTVILLSTLESAIYNITNQQNLSAPGVADPSEDMYRTPLGQAIYSASEKVESNNERLRGLIRALDL